MYHKSLNYTTLYIYIYTYIYFHQTDTSSIVVTLLIHGNYVPMDVMAN